MLFRLICTLVVCLGLPARAFETRAGAAWVYDVDHPAPC